MEPSLFVAVVFVVAGLLALEFGVSSAITEIVAGVLLALVVDVSEMGWLAFLAHFGLLGLMFMAGFEMEPHILRKTWRASLTIGLASILAPLAGTYTVCRFAFELSHEVSALVGIGLSTTSLPLVYQFLRERALLAGEAGQAMVGASMVVDVVAMILLAATLGHLGWATAIFLIAAAPVFWGLPHLWRLVAARYRGSAVEFELRFLLMALVALGFVAESVGIHAAVASFAAGLVLSEVMEEHALVEEKLKGIVFSFFAPVFFLAAGAQIDLRGIEAATVAVTLVLLAVAVALKYLGTLGAARLFFPAQAPVFGALFNYRLTFGIITATVGLDAGIVDRTLFTAMMLVVLASAALPMVLLRDLPSEISD